MPTAKLTSKGQITIPIEVRQKMHLKAGDKIDFFENMSGQFELAAKTASIRDLEGCISKLNYVPTLEQMERDILDAASEDYLRSCGIPTVRAIEKETA